MRMPRHPSRRRVAQKSAPPPRTYLRGIIERARLLFPKPFMQFLKALGAPTDDPSIAHLRAMPIAIATGDFAEVWDNAMDDSRLTETEREALVFQALEMIEADLTHDGLLSSSPRHSRGPMSPTATAAFVSREDELLSHSEAVQ